MSSHCISQALSLCRVSLSLAPLSVARKDAAHAGSQTVQCYFWQTGPESTGLFNSHCNDASDGCWQSHFRAIQAEGNVKAAPMAHMVCAEAPSINPQAKTQQCTREAHLTPLGHSDLHILAGPPTGALVPQCQQQPVL